MAQVVPTSRWTPTANDIINILNIHRLMFNAAVDYSGRFAVQRFERANETWLYNAGTEREHSIKVTTYRVIKWADGIQDPSLLRPVDPLLPEGYQMWNFCEWSCHVVCQALRRLLQSNGCQVDWALTQRLPQMHLFNGNRAENPPCHAVLVIQGIGPTPIIMDLTSGQYGYSGETHWLQDEATYLTRTEPFTGGHGIQVLSPGHELEIVEELEEGDDNFKPYWTSVKDIIEEVSEKIDWQDLLSFDQAHHASFVQDQVRPYFRELREHLDRSDTDESNSFINS